MKFNQSVLVIAALFAECSSAAKLEQFDLSPEAFADASV